MIRLVIGISIHAPRAGSDEDIPFVSFEQPDDFNPRSPCGERRYRLGSGGNEPVNFNPRSPCGERPDYLPLFETKKEFQSTLPVRGATWDPPAGGRDRLISIHAPRAGSDYGFDQIGRFHVISIHAPRAGSDTSPHWTVYSILISIHAPRAGSDSSVNSEERLFL